MSAAPPPGKVSGESRGEWRQRLGWDDDCEEAFRGDGAGDTPKGILVHRLNKTHSLVEVTCARGAYQGSHLFYFWSKAAGAAGPVEFATFEVPRDTLVRTTVKELWGQAEFKTGTRTLIVENRFRGPGDCGTRAVYRFSGTGAALIGFRAKITCDGQPADPAQWPAVDLK